MIYRELKLNNGNQNKAFTLVELAIVVVIIGLLVSGVVGGRSLIESSRINSIMGDVAKYKTAIKAFKLEYDALPGDMTDATDYWGQAGDGSSAQCLTISGTGTQTCNGDGDGTLEFPHSSVADSIHEPWRAWQHLANAEIIVGDFTGISTTACSYANRCADPGGNVPETAITGASWNLMLFDPSWGGVFSSWSGKNETRNAMFLGNPYNLTGEGNAGLWSGLALTVKQQKRIDDKLDDGNPGRGDGYSGGRFSNLFISFSAKFIALSRLSM